MVRKAEENVLTEAMSAARYLWNHRAGIGAWDQIRIGRKVIYLDNQIPALIEDVFHNLKYEQPDGQRPVISAKRKTATGWHLVINLPPGVSFNQVRRDKEFFETAVNGWVEMEWQRGKLHMNITTGELPESIDYAWTPSLYPKMYLPIPIGYSRSGLVILDLTESPHLLVGGSTGYGKTNFIRVLLHSLMQHADICMIDRKGVDFPYIENQILLATEESDANRALTLLNNEHDRRVQVLKRNGAVKVQECAEPLPFIVLIIDELAELRSKESMELLDRLIRLARATGLSVIAASQRTSVKTIPGDTRANFVARICFRVATEADSRVVLGEDCGLAGTIPAIKGRAIYRFGLDLQEVQTMSLDRARAGELAQSIPFRGRVTFEHQHPEPQPAPKRLPPR